MPRAVEGALAKLLDILRDRGTDRRRETTHRNHSSKGTVPRVRNNIRIPGGLLGIAMHHLRGQMHKITSARDAILIRVNGASLPSLPNSAHVVYGEAETTIFRETSVVDLWRRCPNHTTPLRQYLTHRSGPNVVPVLFTIQLGSRTDHLVLGLPGLRRPEPPRTKMGELRAEAA